MKLLFSNNLQELINLFATCQKTEERTALFFEKRKIFLFVSEGVRIIFEKKLDWK